MIEYQLMLLIVTQCCNNITYCVYIHVPFYPMQNKSVRSCRNLQENLQFHLALSFKEYKYVSCKRSEEWPFSCKILYESCNKKLQVLTYSSCKQSRSFKKLDSMQAGLKAL